VLTKHRITVYARQQRYFEAIYTTINTSKIIEMTKLLINIHEMMTL